MVTNSASTGSGTNGNGVREVDFKTDEGPTEQAWYQVGENRLANDRASRKPHGLHTGDDVTIEFVHAIGVNFGQVGDTVKVMPMTAALAPKPKTTL